AGNPRSWTDHLLWHHAAHTIDLFQYQAGETISDCYAVQGPIHPQLNIAMDMGIVAKVPSGAILTLSLSLNNDGPLGSFFRYICDNGTYQALYDDLADGKKNPIDVSKVDVSMDGTEVEDREIEKIIKRQEAIGLKLATDGEYRRSWWHFDFLWGLTGCERLILDHGIQFHGVETRPDSIRVVGKLDFPPDHPMLDHFKFV